jgi:pimeloyl-ACP methyl ester carboxylesterase
LTDPTAHGGKAEDAFHLVLPTMPGYGFSGKPTKNGWGVEKIADAWSILMQRLGYNRYFAQGGDWGSAVTSMIGAQDPEHCAGIHVNMVAAGPDPDTMDDLTEKEQGALAALQYYQDHDSGYSKEQSTRPQTVGYGLVDSPSGQAAWILEKMWAWTDADGHPENVLTRDEILDNIMMYWITKSGASSARLYWESFGNFTGGDVKVPMGGSIFPKEIFRASQRWASKRYPDIVYWNEHDKGGHFAAFEQPEAFVSDVRACFKVMRKGL